MWLVIHNGQTLFESPSRKDFRRIAVSLQAIAVRASLEALERGSSPGDLPDPPVMHQVLGYPVAIENDGEGIALLRSQEGQGPRSCIINSDLIVATPSNREEEEEEEEEMVERQPVEPEQPG